MTYQFDDFALDTGTRRLMWNDEEVHISPKAYDLLALLIENRAQAFGQGRPARKNLAVHWKLEADS